MRRVAPFLAALSLALAFAGSASAGGLSPKQLDDRGWDCFNVEGLGVHCIPPGDGFGGPTVQLLYFDTTDPQSTDATFLGTETLVRNDMYNGQPCPQAGTPDWFFIPPLGYWACHRN